MTCIHIVGLVFSMIAQAAQAEPMTSQVCEGYQQPDVQPVKRGYVISGIVSTRMLIDPVILSARIASMPRLETHNKDTISRKCL